MKPGSRILDAVHGLLRDVEFSLAPASTPGVPVMKQGPRIRGVDDAQGVLKAVRGRLRDVELPLVPPPAQVSPS